MNQESGAINSMLIVGNWKQNPPTLAEAEQITAGIRLPDSNNIEVVLLPPLEFLGELIRKFPQFKWGTQDFISGDVKVDYVLVGHSDQRNPPAGGGETDEVVNKKLLAALEAGFKVILAVGEMEKGNEQSVTESLKVSTKGVSPEQLDRLNVAYEPVWAISTTPGAEVDPSRPWRHEADTPEHASTVISELQKILNVRYLYGGSVDSSNVGSFLDQPNIQGALIGRVSLKPEEFSKILEVAAR